LLAYQRIKIKVGFQFQEVYCERNLSRQVTKNSTRKSCWKSRKIFEVIIITLDLLVVIIATARVMKDSLLFLQTLPLFKYDEFAKHTSQGKAYQHFYTEW